MKAIALWAAFVLSGVVGTAASARTVTVEAGDFDRHDSIVRVAIPGEKGEWELQHGGTSVPLQIDGAGQAWFVLGDLPRGQRRTYTLAPRPASGVTAATITNTGDALKLGLFGKPLLEYRLQPAPLPAGRTDLKPSFQRAGYLHPVFSPSGRLVTDDYPPNHKHHHGIWFTWTHTQFEGRNPDFWNLGDGKGTVEFERLEGVWNGPVHAGFVSRHRAIDLTAKEPKPALREVWELRAYAVGNSATRPYFLFDVDILNECATEAAVKLPKYRYGGICVRGNWIWNGKTQAAVLTSEGETDRAKGDANQVRARWVHLGGLVGDLKTGIALLGHPDNARAPEPLRLNPDEPYVNFAPQQAGDMEITPGHPFRGRYRFVVADGVPVREELDRLWNDYAHPPVARVDE
jgi:hypothetical protein